jgi:hypothetical protein
MNRVRIASRRPQFFAFALVLAACSPPPSTDAPEQQVGGQASVPTVGAAAFASNTAVVFAGDKALELTEPCSRARPIAEGTWTPSDSDIAAMEPALANLVAERLRARSPNAADIAVADYHRQYGGLVLDGRRIIYVNGFRLGEYDDLEAWRSFPHTICDGGPIMFGVEYDPAARQFRNFAFNGPA